MAVRIKSTREVASFTALITAFAVLLPLAVVWTVFALSPLRVPPALIITGMSIAGIVPLLITPPIAWVILSLLRTQADMIRIVDERIMFDMLTGTFNRNHFLDRVRASQQGGPIMIVDADYFKSINDTHGHAMSAGWGVRSSGFSCRGKANMTAKSALMPFARPCAACIPSFRASKSG